MYFDVGCCCLCCFGSTELLGLRFIALVRFGDTSAIAQKNLCPSSSPLTVWDPSYIFFWWAFKKKSFISVLVKFAFSFEYMTILTTATLKWFLILTVLLGFSSVFFPPGPGSPFAAALNVWHSFIGCWTL